MLKHNKFIVIPIMTMLLGINNVATAAVKFKNKKLIPYTATYKVFWKTIPVANSTHKLVEKANNNYIAEVSSIPTTMLIPISQYERSEFKIQESKIWPSKYIIDSKERNKVKNRILAFNWSQNNVIDEFTNEIAFRNISNITQDVVSHSFQLKLDLMHNKTSLNYPIIKFDKMSNYNFKIIGEEEIETDLGKLKTIIVKNNKPQFNRSTTMWLARDLNLTMVKLEQYRKDKLSTNLKIQNYVQM